jgi:sucrose phosphorylase
MGPLSGVFGGAHLLPFFYPIDGADAGFDPIDHTQTDPKLGTWDDVRELGNTVELVADLIVNHVSSSSPQFQDYSKNGQLRSMMACFSPLTGFSLMAPMSLIS